MERLEFVCGFLGALRSLNKQVNLTVQDGRNLHSDSFWGEPAYCWIIAWRWLRTTVRAWRSYLLWAPLRQCRHTLPTIQLLFHLKTLMAESFTLMTRLASLRNS